MTDVKSVAKLYEAQVSLTEWLQRVNHVDAAALGEEDNYKRERIGRINKIIGLPYDKPTTFEARDLASQTTAFKKFLKEHGDELCALRLIPKQGNSKLPKLRMRGKTIRNVMQWFVEQKIDPEKYTADFVPHSSDDGWATIFVVNDVAIFGEIYFGGHHVLTQGMHAGKAPHVFSYDFNDWSIDPHNEKALDYLKSMVEMLKVDDAAKREQLQIEVKAQFANNYLKGYFETTHSEGVGTWFIDYNRILGERYDDFRFQKIPVDTAASSVSGRAASGGLVKGTAYVITDTSRPADFPDGGIIVCKMTSPDYLPLMQKAAAVVTDQGGILCHAAIVSREIGIPCIVGTENATQLLKTGDGVEVDANVGTVKIIT